MILNLLITQMFVFLTYTDSVLFGIEFSLWISLIQSFLGENDVHN